MASKGIHPAFSMSSCTFFLALVLAIALMSLGSAFAQNVRHLNDPDKEGENLANENEWEAGDRILAGKHTTDKPDLQTTDADDGQPPVQSNTNNIAIFVACGAIVVSLVCTRWRRACVRCIRTLTQGIWRPKEEVICDSLPRRRRTEQEDSAHYYHAVPEANELDQEGIDEDAELYENENVSQPAGNDGDDVLMRLIGNALDHAHGAVPVEPQQPADPNPLNEDAIPMDPGVALALPANNIPERQNANEVGVGNNH